MKVKRVAFLNKMESNQLWTTQNSTKVDNYVQVYIYVDAGIDATLTLCILAMFTALALR